MTEETKFCENCGEAFTCRAASNACWCFKLPLWKGLIAAGGDCLCPKCLTEDSIYEENGAIVFTEKFHFRRGYCCKNDCRHCPYPKV